MKKEKKIWKRNCPTCNKELTTENKYWYIKALKNNTRCAKCTLSGKKKSTEARLNMSKNHANVCGKNNPFYGKKHTKETKYKCGIKNKGKCRLTDEYINELKIKMCGKGNYFYGKHHSKEALKKLSYAKTNEHKEKLRIALIGKPTGRKGKQMSIEARKNMRLSAIKRVKRDNNGMFQPSVNKNETSYFKKMEKINGWDGIYYGKNKYQYFIQELGYFPDYYEPNLNIIIEYDEKYHYDVNWNLKQKDICRQNEIISYLKCEFFRYNENKNILYEVIQ